MTSSPTPAALPGARAREVLTQAAERAGCKEVPAAIRAGEVVLIDSTIALDALATPPASDAAVPAGEGFDREEIARVLFDQRRTPHNFDDAEDADPESDAGTLRSICFDDADAVIACLGPLAAAPKTDAGGDAGGS